MVARLKEPGLYPDGGGLYLQVTRGVDGGARRSWVLRFRTIAGKPREMGLGSALDVALADARIDADAARKLVRKGLDPIEERKLTRKKAIAEAVRAMSFKQCAEAYIAAHEASWKNPKHRQQWSRTLETYAYPVFGDLPVNSVDVALVTKVLDPIWQTKTETAARVRGRIESVLDWASVRGLRDGANPARWRGHLQRALPARSKVQRVRHHPALPYTELPAFLAQLRAMRSLSARALEFLILTATRTSETTAAEWREFDFRDEVWIIPSERMKAGREHRVPLSRRGLVLLRELKLLGDPRWVFPGNKGRSHLSNMAMLQLIRGMDRPSLTVHGFRSTFRDWTAEQTNFPREVAEAALAHAIGDKVEAAYRRGDLFEKRRGLMKTWGDYCCGSVDQGISGTPKRTAGGTQGSA